MRINDLIAIHPHWRKDFIALADAMLVQGFRPFESYRTDHEQMRVYNLGTSKAKPGESPHGWGLGCDFVPYTDGTGWHWPKSSWAGWKELERQAALVGLLAPLAWDKPHVQVPDWRAHRDQRWRDDLRIRYGA